MRARYCPETEHSRPWALQRCKRGVFQLDLQFWGTLWEASWVHARHPASTPSLSPWQMAETRQCVHVCECVWHLRFSHSICSCRPQVLVQCWTIIYCILFLCNLQGVMTTQCTKSYSGWQHSQGGQGNEGSIDEGVWGKKQSVCLQTFSPLPWNNSKSIFLSIHTYFSSNSTWDFVQIQPSSSLRSPQRPLVLMTNGQNI